MQINKCIITPEQNQIPNPMIISIDAENAFNKIQQPFMIKALKKLGIVFYRQYYTNTDKLKLFSLKSGI
jgi:hypothetical protein